MNKIVTMLGGGAFGTSIATLLAENGFEVKLWCHEQEVVDCIKKDHENKNFLPGIKLNPSIKPTSDLQEAVKDSKWIFEAVPVKFLRNILNQIKDFVTDEQNFVVLSKGIEQDTFLLPSGVIKDLFKKNTISVMAGPNFAKEIAQKSYTGATVTSEDMQVAKELGEVLSNSYFQPYLSEDFIGVQVGGAIKNVITLAVGIAKGSGCSQNTIALLLTRGFAEIAHVSVCLGGKKETVYGLSGFGDLVLSATGSLGRNLEVGALLGQGKSLQEIEKEKRVLPEGINTVQSVYNLTEKHGWDLPICKGTYDFVFKGISFDVLLKKIINQPLEME